MWFKRTPRPKLSDVQYTLDTLLNKRAAGDKPPAETKKLRRAVPRQPVDWNAKYRFQYDPVGEWRDCLVTDISTAGCGLRVFGLTAEEVQTRRIDVLVQLRGDVRNTAEGTENDLRLGVEFIDLAGDAANYMASLKRTGTRW